MSLRLEMCLFVNHSSSSVCTVVLLKLTFVLFWAMFLYPLLRRWQFTIHTLCFQCKNRVSAELAGVFLTLFFTWNVAQHIRKARSKIKHSHTPWVSSTPSFKMMNEVWALTIEHSVFSVMAALIVEILFMLFSVYSPVLWTVENEWIWSVQANRFSTN